MGTKLYVGLDIGGTTVKVGAFSEAGERLGKLAVPTPPLVDEKGYGAVTDGISQLAASLEAAADDVRGIGLAVPAPVPADGNVQIVANMDLDLLGLKAALEAAFAGATVAYVNDANAAALGELWQGGACGLKSCVLITLGTGVGGGVVVDGKVVAGANGAAGEIGHITVNPAEPLECGCGRHGCLEQYASAKGMVRVYREECARLGTEPVALSGDTDTLSLFDAYKVGDEAAKAAVSLMCDRLGLALSIVSGVTDPERFVIGGGVAGGFDLFKDELAERYRHYVLGCCADTPIVVAELGNDAGIFGAAYEGLLAAQA